MASRHGFTIIELIVVMLIMGIMAAAAAPKYSDALASYRVNAAANRVAADLRMIRQYALKASVTQSVVFDASANSYAASSMPDLDHPGTAYSENLGASEYATDLTSVSFTAGTVQFDIFGRPNQAGTIALKAGSRTKTVQIDAEGTVRVL